MKRSAGIAAVIALMAVAYTGASWYVGKRAQTTVEELVDQANDRVAKALGADLSGTGVKFAISEYKRHVFSSDIIYTLQFNESNGKPAEYLLSDHLQHGPFPVGAVKQGDFVPSLAISNIQLIPSAITKKWFESLKGESPVAARTRIGFVGAGESTWHFKPLNIVDQGQTTKFSGGTVDISVYNDFRDSEANGYFDAFSVLSSASGESLELKGIKINSKTSFPEDETSQVQATMASADQLMLSMPGAAAIRAARSMATEWTLSHVVAPNLTVEGLRRSMGGIRGGD